MVVRPVYPVHLILDFFTDTLEAFVQHFLIIRHLMTGVTHHRAVGDIRDMGTGRGAGVSFFFEVGVKPGQVIVTNVLPLK